MRSYWTDRCRRKRKTPIECEQRNIREDYSIISLRLRNLPDFNSSRVMSIINNASFGQSGYLLCFSRLPILIVWFSTREKERERVNAKNKGEKEMSIFTNTYVHICDEREKNERRRRRRAKARRRERGKGRHKARRPIEMSSTLSHVCSRWQWQRIEVNELVSKCTCAACRWISISCWKKKQIIARTDTSDILLYKASISPNNICRISFSLCFIDTTAEKERRKKPKRKSYSFEDSRYLWWCAK